MRSAWCQSEKHQRPCPMGLGHRETIPLTTERESDESDSKYIVQTHIHEKSATYEPLFRTPEVNTAQLPGLCGQPQVSAVVYVRRHSLNPMSHLAVSVRYAAKDGCTEIRPRPSDTQTHAGRRCVRGRPAQRHGGRHRLPGTSRGIQPPPPN